MPGGLLAGCFQRINISYSVAPHGCETWSFTSREERRLRVNFTCSIPCIETNFCYVCNTNKCTVRMYINSIVFCLIATCYGHPYWPSSLQCMPWWWSIWMTETCSNKTKTTKFIYILTMHLLVLMHKSRLRVFENRVLRRIFGHKRDEVTGSGEDYKTRSFTFVLQIKYTGDQIKKKEM